MKDMKMKYLIITLISVFLIVCCSGCGKQKEEKQTLEDKINKDIYIEDRTHNFLHEQTITISSNNGYRCIYSNTYFNEEKKQYVITFKFGVPIEEE